LKSWLKDTITDCNDSSLGHSSNAWSLSSRLATLVRQRRRQTIYSWQEKKNIFKTAITSFRLVARFWGVRNQSMQKSKKCISHNSKRFNHWLIYILASFANHKREVCIISSTTSSRLWRALTCLFVHQATDAILQLYLVVTS